MAPCYLSLDQALADSRFRDAGSVPTLKAVNAGERPVLRLDGEELAGANRTESSI